VAQLSLLLTASKGSRIAHHKAVARHTGTTTLSRAPPWRRGRCLTTKALACCALLLRQPHQLQAVSHEVGSTLLSHVRF